MTTPYYEIQRYSNSYLSYLKRILTNGKEANPENYRIGNLVDNAIFENDESEEVEDLVNIVKSDNLMKNLLESKDFVKQKEYYKKFYGLPFKCRLDGEHRDFVFEFKTTACTNQANFENIIDILDYDRQLYVYMCMSGKKKAIIFGISKKNKKIFKYIVNENDNVYLKGKAKTEELIEILKMYL